MATGKKKFITDERLGKEEINFPEFPLGICSQQQPKVMPAKLEFHDLVGNDQVKVTVLPSAFGYPNQQTRDLLRALMRLTYRKNRFNDSKVETSLREILKELGVTPSGQSIETVKKNLRILAGTRIEYEKSFFDKNISDRLKTTIGINIISSYIFQEAEYTAQQKELGIDLSDQLKSGIFWNQEFFDMSLRDSKNLIDFDYTYYISLENNITKELYLLLNKRAYSKPIFKIDMKILAFEKLGMSRTLENKLFKVRQQLKKAHEELMKTGFLTREPAIEKINGSEYVMYFFTPIKTLFDRTNDKNEDDIPNISHPDYDPANFKESLIKLGFTEGEIGKLYKRYDIEILRKSVKLCLLQKRVESPKKWLYKCLTDQYDLSVVDKVESQEQELKIQEALFQEKIEQKQMQKAENDDIELKIEEWIRNNQCAYLFLTEATLADIQLNNETMYKNILRSSHKKNLTPLEVVAQSPLYNYKTRSIILEYI